MTTDTKPQNFVESTSDARTINNIMRHEYKVLNENDKMNMKAIKDLGLEFHTFIKGIETFEHNTSRELEMAKIKIEEAVMWAVKHITK